MRALRLAAAAFAASILLTAPSLAQTAAPIGQPVNGALARGDRTLDSGEFMDEFTVQGRAGQRLVVSMQSSQFDTYLFVRGPNGFAEDNDDAPGGGTNSVIDVTLPADGAYRVVATSFAPGESGAYALRVDVGAAVVTPAQPALAGGAALTVGRSARGALARGDQQLGSGEFVDVFTLQGRAGQRVELALTSTAFDPYLMISGPGGFADYNDDDPESGTTNSRLVVTLPDNGVYQVQVTSYAVGETGAYQLAVSDAANAPQTPAGLAGRTGTGSIALGQSRTATLAQGDATLESGEFADSYTFVGTAGEAIQIDLRSQQFDTYLMLVTPSGAQEDNDDVGSGVTDSRIETQLGESGEYQIVVTSYSAGESGGYELSLGAAGADRSNTLAVGSPGAAASRPGQAGGGARLAVDVPSQGQLSQGDSQLSSGEFIDRFTFMGRRGQRATIDMSSDQIDSYLMVTAPSGAQEDNDDADSSTRNARITMRLAEDGQYTVGATSYRPGEAGRYSVRLSLNDTGPAANATMTGGRIYAVMVGISDYGGRASDLAFTAEDAEKIAETLDRRGVLAEGSILLTEAEATRARVTQAIQQVAAMAGPEDAFLFFYSGHGDQQPTQASSTEPDGLNESIVLRDGDITDDELARLFAGVRARVSILALDACFSGGFARDVVSRPNVMGLFSSEEDLTSSVAEKFRAGGYLSHFLRNGLAGDSDADGDAIITAGELSAYLRNQFADQVQDEQAQTRDGQRNYQYLVVDRGGVKIDDMLVALR